MPSVNWDFFEKLQGSVEINFEILCRSIIRRHYGMYGDFRALSLQPGVEFHLKLHSPCSLGEVGRWLGWQCRWYDLPSGKAIGTTRRNKITGAIKTTEKILPGLTDWILITRRPLTKKDQEWFYKINTHMRLALWSSIDIEEHLSGNAEIFRSTYFGELVLTHEILDRLHKQSVASIRNRWRPEVHQIIDVERDLMRMLGDPNSWSDISDLIIQIADDNNSLRTEFHRLTKQYTDLLMELSSLADSAHSTLSKVYLLLVKGDYELLSQELASTTFLVRPEIVNLPRHLRSGREPVALFATNTLADIRVVEKKLQGLKENLNENLIGVLSDAGCGKTEMAAQLTSAMGERPAGILFHGRGLNAGDDLNDFVSHIVINGTPLSSMENLIAAVDAAGQRFHKRMPIVIDGINESEDPRDWKALISSLKVVLQPFHNVLIVFTVRTAFADESMPSDIEKLEIPNFGDDTIDAIRRYFSYYKINPADAELPIELLSHPLTLRFFCEVTNPKREQTVGIEAMPGSLTALFERYIDQAAERIAELAPRTRRFYTQDVRVALDKIGFALWEYKSRSLDLATLRHLLNDEQYPWNESLVNALEQDGILLRVKQDNSANPYFSAIYDALGGHLISEAILARFGSSGVETWIRDSTTIITFSRPVPGQHPLATDLFRALVGLLPRRLNRQQLWPLLDEPLRSSAISLSADLEGIYLDTQTVKELARLSQTVQPIYERPDLFDRFRQTRGSVNHPLNSIFLDALLKSMAPSARDFRWTEWTRKNSKSLLDDLQRYENRWRKDLSLKSLDDKLRARWIMWELTSTVRELRDQATLTLYWFGRGDPNALFELCLDSLSINDDYVPERLLAASYGVVMAYQIPAQGFEDILKTFIVGLGNAFLGKTACHPTNHWLERLYVESIIKFACNFYKNVIPEGLDCEGKILFAPGKIFEPIKADDPRAVELQGVLRIDFTNYTLGRLLEGRHNYDMSHPGHQAAVAHVLSTAWAMGWRESQLGIIDKDIAYYSHGDSTPVERYGKKYGWIGFYTYAGILNDNGQLPKEGVRLPDVQIDPSFPLPSPSLETKFPQWVETKPKDNRRWIRNGIINIPDEVLYSQTIGPYSGPWIAVSGHLENHSSSLGRHVFGLLTAILVDTTDTDKMIAELNKKGRYGNFFLPEVPSDYYTFAGEIPWAAQFASVNEPSEYDTFYQDEVEVNDNQSVKVEILAHRYAWEGYHSPVNNAEGSLVPSKLFSSKFDLRGVPQSFSQQFSDGVFAALSFGAPVGFTGNILYLREDLVHQYASGRDLIWFAWGERQLYPFPVTVPNWYEKTRQENTDVWRLIKRGNELSGAFKKKLSSRIQ